MLIIIKLAVYKCKIYIVFFGGFTVLITVNSNQTIVTYPRSKYIRFPQSADAMNRQWKARLIYFSAVGQVSYQKIIDLFISPKVNRHSFIFNR